MNDPSTSTPLSPEPALLVDRAQELPMRQATLHWAIQRGGRSGRIARQFAADWVGSRGLKMGKGR